jgi:hypothetical protein
MTPIESLVKTLMEPGRLTLADIDGLTTNNLRLLTNALDHWQKICELHLERRRDESTTTSPEQPQ